jgi:hypothetical protein
MSLMGLVSRALPVQTACVTARDMKGGPSRPAIRCGPQTAASCCCQSDGGERFGRNRFSSSARVRIVRSAISPKWHAQTEFVTSSLVCSTLGKEVPPALGREPFALMQGPTVAKLAMEASRRHYLHEPRRRPHSTFIVVRHLHFPGNRGFGVRNELCSHIDYSLCSLEAARLKRRRCVIEVSMVGLLYAFHPAACRARPCVALSAGVRAGRTPAHGRFMRVALASVPVGTMDRHSAGGRVARPVVAPIAIAGSDGVVIRAVAAVGSSRSVSCVAMCPSVDACNAHGC